MKRFANILLFVFLVTGPMCFAQPDRDWVHVAAGGGTGADCTEAVFVDASGNSYATGSFTGSITIGGDTYNAGLTTQCFVVKLNAAGTVQWSIVSSGDDKAFGHCIHVDDGGNVYVGGHHTQTTTTFGSLSINATANQEAFILKLSPTGNPLHLMGPDNPNNGKSQILGITGNNDNVYVTGFYFQQPLQYGGIVTAAPTQDDIWIAKIDSALSAAAWIQTHGGTASGKEHGTDIAIDGSDVFVTGYGDNKQFAIVATGPDYIVPVYDFNSIWLLRCAENNGNVGWATHAGSQVANCGSHGLALDGTSVYITGFVGDSCRFNSTPNKSGPWTWNDTLFSAGSSDIFVAKYAYNGNIQAVWSEGGTGVDKAYDIAYDPTCTELEITGEFNANILFGGTDNLTPNGKDVFVSAYDQNGVYQWSFHETSTGNEVGWGIHANNGRTSMGGEFSGNITFGTSSSTNINNKGNKDYFVSSFQCANASACGPTITCPPNDTVTANASCNFVMTDYVGTESVVDGCAVGYSVAQDISVGTNLSAGTHPVTLTVTDNNLNVDQCIFNLVVEANVNPTVVNCGDLLVDETTVGSGNNNDSWSCSGLNTLGEDNFYQITVPSGNYLLSTTITNAADGNDNDIRVFWVGGSCPTSGNCLFTDNYDINDGEFDSNGQNSLIFSAVGPGTYYFVVDADNGGDGVDEYDIEFGCVVSGVEFDDTSPCEADANLNGVGTSVNGSSNLEVEPCQTVTICDTLFVKNVNAGEWMDTVEMYLGPCFTNVTNLTPDGPLPNGTFDILGTWNATYNAVDNEIEWGFDYSGFQQWGDGPGSNYTCAEYTPFCFDADIAANCLNNDSLKIGIRISDDGVDGSPPGTAAGFDFTYSDSLFLNLPDAGWNYGGATVWCQDDTNPIATITGDAGGTFSSTAGLVWANQPTGEINLAGSTPGTYNITYSVGPCPTDSIISITINAEDDPSIAYTNTTLCNGDPIEDTLSVGTSGGTFSASPVGLSINASSGQIDPSLSAPGVYQVYYNTPGPACPKIDSVQISIKADEDASFTYALTTLCTADPAQDTISTGTSGGTFTASAAGITLNASSGQITPSTSTPGVYWVYYTTPGIECQNVDSVQITINAIDDATFSYAGTTFCNNDANADTVSTATPGGTFTTSSVNLITNATSGQINVSGSTPGVYQVYYQTPAGACQNIDSVEITINAEDDPFFDYPQAAYCQGDADPTATNVATAGGTFTGPAQVVFLNASTGLIDLDASTAGGPYTITYTTAGTCPNSTTFDVTINAEDDPFFDYPQTAYCPSETDPVATNVATSGGTFSALPQVVFLNTSTGLIDLDASTAGGTYTITHNTAGTCPNSATFNITFHPSEDASFGYTTTSYCTNDTDPTPSFITEAGGSFSENTGDLSINATSGTIDISASVPGSYYAVYTTAGPCPDIDSVQVTITPVDNPFFDYPQTNYCQGDADPIATNVLTAGGTFSAPAAVVINPADGTIDLDASTAGGPYAIKYVTPGICPDSSTFNITINPEDDASFNYAQFVFCNNEGTEDTLFTGTAGGTFTTSSTNLSVHGASGQIDPSASLPGVYQVYYTTPGPSCVNVDSVQITINAEDDPGFAYAATTFCNNDGLIDTLSTNNPGGTFSDNSSNIVVNALSGQINLNSSLPGVYQVYYTTSGLNCPNIDSVEITINAEDDASFAYAQTVFCNDDLTEDTLSTGTSGGSFSASSVNLSVHGASGQIDPAASLPGVYQVYYTTPGPACPNIDSIEITINPEQDPSFSYTNTVFCNNDANEDTLSTVTPGGTFSDNSSNLVVNSLSGQIDVSSSLPGNYQVYYTTPGPTCANIDSVTIVINAEDDASFAYAQTVFCNDDGVEDTLSTNMAGGTFSVSSTNLIVDGSSGQIDITNSLPGVYQVYYTTSGAFCPNTDSVEITINAEDDPAFTYPTTSLCADAPDLDPDFVATAGGTWSFSPLGLDLDTGDGEIEIDDSAPGSYTIYYTTSGICPNIDSLENFTIIPLDNAGFDYSLPICTPGTNPLAEHVVTPGGTFSESTGNVQFNDVNTGEINLNTTSSGTWAIDYLTNGTCPNTSTFVIEILPPIDPTFWIPDTICLFNGSINMEDSVSLQADESNLFYSYGTNGGAQLNGTNNNLLQPNPTGPGTYFITQVVTSIHGCVDSSTLQLEILPTYSANFSNPDTICQALTTYNLNNLFNGSTDTGGTWSGIGVFNDSIWNTGSLPAGDYDLTYSVGVGQCADSVTQTVHLKFDVDSSWTVPAGMCSNASSIDLDTTITGTPGGIWSGNGVAGSLFDPSIAQSGTHDITYTIDGHACSESYTQSITIYEAPIADAGLDMEVCDSTFELQAISNLPNLGYWLNEASTIFLEDSTEENLNIQVSDYGTITYYYYVDQNGLCSALDSVNITFDQLPIADAGQDQFLDFEFETNLAAVDPVVGSGEWSLIEGDAVIWDMYDSATYVNDIGVGSNQFLWTVTNGSCPEQSDLMIITVNDLWIPDVVSPNFDGKNDFFVIKGIESKQNKVEIFNRWGQLRFSEENYQSTWDGTDNNGNRLEDDTYFYIINIEDEHIIKGYVVLKR